VYRGPTLLLVDPRSEEPLKRPLKKLVGGRDGKKVGAVLRAAIEALASADRVDGE
jgi:hypothetical protein